MLSGYSKRCTGMLCAYRALADHHAWSTTWFGHCCSHSKTEQSSSWILHAVLHWSFSIFPFHLQKHWQRQTGVEDTHLFWTSFYLLRSHQVFFFSFSVLHRKDVSRWHNWHMPAQTQLQRTSYLYWNAIRRKWREKILRRTMYKKKISHLKKILLENENNQWQSILTWHGAWNELFPRKFTPLLPYFNSMLRHPQLCT